MQNSKIVITTGRASYGLMSSTAWCGIKCPPTRSRWFLVSMPRLSGTVGNVLSKVLSLLRKVVRYHTAARRHIVTADTTLPCGNKVVEPGHRLPHSLLVAWPGCGVGAVFGAVAAAVIGRALPSQEVVGFSVNGRHKRWCVLHGKTGIRTGTF